MLQASYLIVYLIDGGYGFLRGCNHLAEIHKRLLTIISHLLDELIADSTCRFGLIGRSFCPYPAFIDITDYPELEVIGDFLRLLAKPLSVDYQEVL